MSHRLRQRWLRRGGFDLPLLLAALALAPHAYAQDVMPAAPPPPPPANASVPAPGTPPAQQADVVRRDTEPSALSEVRFEPEEPSLALMMRTGELPYRHTTRFASTLYDIRYSERGFTPLYSQICAGPCATDLAPRDYELAVSKNGRRPVPAGAVHLNGPSIVRASYDDRRGLRILGGVIIAVGAVGGVSMIIAAADMQNCSSGSCVGSFNGTLFGASIGVILGAAVAGTLLASLTDTAHVSVTPLTTPTPGALKESPLAALGAAARLQGAALTYRF